MYRRIIKPILFSLTIERAHSAVLLLLRIIGLIPGGRWLLRKCYGVQHPALEREVFGIKFANPVGLAAGFDRNGEAFRELAALGFGFVEVGTVTPRPQAGNPRPRVFRLPKDQAIVNRIGLANRGLAKTISCLRRPHEGFIVGCNIGKNTATAPEDAQADYLKLFRNLYQYADYFTVNISCDNACREGATHTRGHILDILNPLFDFRRGQNQYRPIMLKVSPDMTDRVINEISDILLETPLDGIVATNGTHCREGLHTSHTTLDKIGSGRLSGTPLTQRAVEVVRRIHTRSGGNFPIIGVGGIMSPDDAKAMLDAGADLIQLYTGYIYNGPGLVRDICRSLIADAEAKAAEGAKAAAEAKAGAAAQAEAGIAAQATTAQVTTASESGAAPEAEPTDENAATGGAQAEAGAQGVATAHGSQVPAAEAALPDTQPEAAHTGTEPKSPAP